MTRKRYYYAVAAGRTPGVYNTWKEVQTQVRRFPNAIFKKFTMLSDAENFVRKKQPASISLSLKEVEASQPTRRMSGPPKVLSMVSAYAIAGTITTQEADAVIATVNTLVPHVSAALSSIVLKKPKFNALIFLDTALVKSDIKNLTLKSKYWTLAS